MTDKQKYTIREMRQRGTPYAAIAEMLGISINTVKSYCRRENITSSDAAADRNVCRNCGSPLTQSEGIKQRVFCSDKCRYTWWNCQRKYAVHDATYNRTCLHCGSVFDSYGNKHRKFCGRECYMHSRYGEGLP